MCHVPHYEVERTSRYEALVSGVVFLLASKVPGHEGDAAKTGLTLTNLLVVGPVTDHYTYCGEVTPVLVCPYHPVGVWREMEIGGGRMEGVRWKKGARRDRRTEGG